MFKEKKQGQKKTSVDVQELMEAMRNAAWFGGDSLAVITNTAGDMLILEGKVYESSYEYFETECDAFLYRNRKIVTLYKVTEIQTAAYRNEKKVTGSPETVKKIFDKLFGADCKTEIMNWKKRKELYPFLCA